MGVTIDRGQDYRRLKIRGSERFILLVISEGQRDSLTRTLPLGTLEGFVGSKSLVFTLSRTETYRGPRELAPNGDDSLSKTSMRFVNTIVLGLYTRSS